MGDSRNALNVSRRAIDAGLDSGVTNDVGLSLDEVDFV